MNKSKIKAPILRSYEIPERLESNLISRAASAELPKSKILCQLVIDYLDNEDHNRPHPTPPPEYSPLVNRRYHFPRDLDERVMKTASIEGITAGRIIRNALYRGLGHSFRER